MSAWLRTGQALALSLVDTPILASVFTSLDNPLLFDAAVDTLVDIIRETQELSENMLVIQELVGRLIALREVLARSETLDDSDRMRGYCRIFVEAGEWYEPLIVQHSSNFLPLVQAIQQCSAYEDLDVVGITLNFWYKLSKNVRRRKEDPEVQVLLEVFAGLVETIIGHLHYPADEGSLVGQERDDFRNFRHTIGDTLKDCCAVLSATVCLRRSYEILSATLAHAASKGVEPKWQDVEAPLFSMRSMGAEVDPSEEGIMPLIMDLLPQLPTHSKIRYATILVIGRYTVWIDRHPSYIPFHLSYVSAGFQESDDVEVYAAAAQTIKYLCKDCSTHLIPFIAQLHSFVLSIASKLAAEELSNLMEAMAYIIAVMPLDEAAAALQLFCAPELALLSAMAADGGTTQGKRELRLAGDALDRLDVMLSIVGPFDLPPSCAGTASQAWSVLSAFLIAYSSIPSLAEKSCTLLRRSLDFFGPAVPPLVPAILEQMTTSFEQTGASSFLWITGKIVGKFGREPGLEGLVGASFGRESEALFIMLGNKTPALVGDGQSFPPPPPALPPTIAPLGADETVVLDDYIHLLSTLIEYTPQIPLSSPSFPSIFRTVLAALTLFSPSVISAALDLLRTILGHESLLDPTLSPSYPQFAQTIHTAVQSNSTQLIQLLLQELIKLEDETSSSVLTLFRVLALGFSDVLGREIPIALGGIEDRIVSSTEKIEFLQKFSTYVFFPFIPLCPCESFRVDHFCG